MTSSALLLGLCLYFYTQTMILCMTVYLRAPCCTVMQCIFLSNRWCVIYSFSVTATYLLHPESKEPHSKGLFTHSFIKVNRDLEEGLTINDWQTELAGLQVCHRDWRVPVWTGRRRNQDETDANNKRTKISGFEFTVMALEDKNTFWPEWCRG